MNPSEVDKGNQDEKKDRADSDKTRLVPADLEIPERETKKSTKNLTCHWRCLPRFELSGRDVHLPANRFPTAILAAFSLVAALGEFCSPA